MDEIIRFGPFVLSLIAAFFIMINARQNYLKENKKSIKQYTPEQLGYKLPGITNIFLGGCPHNSQPLPQERAHFHCCKDVSSYKDICILNPVDVLDMEVIKHEYSHYLNPDKHYTTKEILALNSDVTKLQEMTHGMDFWAIYWNINTEDLKI